MDSTPDYGGEMYHTKCDCCGQTIGYTKYHLVRVQEFREDGIRLFREVLPCTCCGHDIPMNTLIAPIPSFAIRRE